MNFILSFQQFTHAQTFATAFPCGNFGILVKNDLRVEDDKPSGPKHTTLAVAIAVAERHAERFDLISRSKSVGSVWTAQ